ncbi:hypothetical protein V6N11_067473 [Hibiscus sabdariffa]|uniref:CCHC-type domain-containing protein n=1 Tax=Hibiscus sabdariffa TaxID=183260 RepID=A0ABR2SQU4_9ROSI
MSLPLVLSGNSADPRLPKRQRQRDEDPPDVPVSTNGNPASGMECDSPAAARTIVSYNDIVTSSGETPQDSEIFDLDDADIDLLEEDVAIGSMNGFMEFGIWKPSHPIKRIDIENDFFLVKFSDRCDYLKVLTEGPWTIFGHYVTVEQWSIDFQPTQASPSRLMAWIRLPGLPLTLYKRSFIEAIGNQIGSVIKIDLQTDNGRYGRFARLAVSLNLHHPHISKLIINGHTQVVEYESRPTVCFSCGIYGHLKDICPKLKDSDPPTSGHPDASPPVPTSTSPTPAEDFGSQSISPITNPIFVESDNLRDSLPESREPAINPSPLVNDRPVTQETNMAVDSVSPVIAPAPPANLGHVTKDVTQSHATTKPPTHGSHVTLLQQASSSSKPPRVISHQASKPVVSLDPSKHHAIHIPDGDNPRLPMEATTGNISRQNHEDMAE